LQFEANSDDINADLFSALLDLKAVESASVMERALAARRVELAVVGVAVSSGR
jgi:hypothetical protein